MTSQLEGGRWVNVVSASLPCACWILATNVSRVLQATIWVVKIHEGPETNEYKWHKIYKTDFFSGFVDDYTPQKKTNDLILCGSFLFISHVKNLHLSSYPSPNHFWDQPFFPTNKGGDRITAAFGVDVDLRRPHLQCVSSPSNLHTSRWSLGKSPTKNTWMTMEFYRWCLMVLVSRWCLMIFDHFL